MRYLLFYSMLFDEVIEYQRAQNIPLTFRQSYTFDTQEYFKNNHRLKNQKNLRISPLSKKVGILITKVCTKYCILRDMSAPLSEIAPLLSYLQTNALIGFIIKQ